MSISRYIVVTSYRTEPGAGSAAGTVDTTCPGLRRARLGGGWGSGPSL